jgi:membrane protein
MARRAVHRRLVVSMTALLPVVLSQLGGYDLTYGSLAGVVVMLLFFYLIGLGLVFGAHLNAALAEPPEPALERRLKMVNRQER